MWIWIRFCGVTGWQERCEEDSEKGRGETEKDWIPAFAGMTMGGSARVTGEAIPGMTEEEELAGSGHSHPHPDPPPSRGTELEGSPSRGREGLVLIAVARDEAFCFYYPDNFDLLRKAGAELRFFAPLAGESLPEDAAGVYLGGGYPEVYAENLASHEEFLAAIRAAVARGVPVYAECGGLMVLSRFIDTLDGRRFPMAGVLPFGTRMLPRRKALGYTEVLLREQVSAGRAEFGAAGA